MLNRSLCVLALVLSCSLSASASMIYTGQLAWDDQATYNPLVAADSWANTDTKIEWEVEQLADAWKYSYRLTVSGKDISHIIFETSESLTAVEEVCSNISLECADGCFDVYSATSQGKSNPGMPNEAYGVKFNMSGATKVLEISFVANRNPVWGDFYAKAGGGKTPSYVYNAGFSTVEPSGDPNEPEAGRILVPDTVGIPEPASLALMAAGGLGLLRRRKLG